MNEGLNDTIIFCKECGGAIEEHIRIRVEEGVLDNTIVTEPIYGCGCSEYEGDLTSGLYLDEIPNCWIPELANA